MLFTSKTKILQFHLLLLICATIFLSDTAKYLSVEINSKQNCKMSIKNRNNKAFMVYYICKEILSRNLDLKLYIVMWTEDNTFSIYINGFKMDCGIGAEVYTNVLHISLYSPTKLSHHLTSGSTRHRKGLQSCIEEVWENTERRG